MTISLGKAAPISRAELQLNKLEQAYDHKVARRNERFAKASPARKRVTIAKDVLEWLGEGKIIAAPGVYLSHQLRSPGDVDTYQRDTSGQVISGRVLEDRVDGGKCSACALGAVFACAVEREGGMHDFWRQGRQERIQDKLAPYFDRAQLELIESAFEKNAGFYTGKDRGLAVTAEAFGRNWLYDAQARMKAIMQNIIRNKGTFDPTDVPSQGPAA